MVDTYREAPRRRLMPPTLCSDKDVLQILKVPAPDEERAEAVAALGERLLAEHCQQPGDEARAYAAIHEAALGCSSTLRMDLLDRKVRCHCVGAGVEELLRLFFGSCLVQGDACDDDVILFAAGEAYGLLSRSGIWWTKRSETPLSMVKCLFLDYLCRSAEDRFILIHSAMVQGPNGVVMVMGPSYSGKSTLAIHCHYLGLPMLGDDICAVETRTLAAVALPKTINVRPSGKNEFHLYPELVRRAEQSDVYGMIQPEFFIPLDGAVKRPIEKIFILIGYGDAPRIERCNGRDVVTHLLGNCLTEGGRAPGLFRALCGVVRQCNGGYRVWSGGARATAERVARECLCT